MQWLPNYITKTIRNYYFPEQIDSSPNNPEKLIKRISYFSVPWRLICWRNISSSYNSRKTQVRKPSINEEDWKTTRTHQGINLKKIKEKKQKQKQNFNNRMGMKQNKKGNLLSPRNNVTLLLLGIFITRSLLLCVLHCFFYSLNSPHTRSLLPFSDAPSLYPIQKAY